MTTPGYPGGYWTQHHTTLSQNKSGRDIGDGDAQEHAKHQYDHLMPSPDLYDLRIGKGAYGEPCPVGLWAGADNLGSQYAGSDLPKTSGHYDWAWQQKGSAANGVGSAGVLPALGAAPMNRAGDDSIPPHQEHIGPNVPLMGPQMQIHNLGYPNRQGKPRLPNGVPPLAPQLGTADAEYYARHSDQGAADMLSRNISPKVHFDGYGAYQLEISEGAGSGGTGTLMSIGHISDLNESESGTWPMSTALAGQYGVEQFTGYTQAAQTAQSPYDLQTLEYGHQNGLRVMPDLAYGPIAWTAQQQSAPATIPAEFSLSWRAPRAVPSHHGQYPNAYSETHTGGNPMSTGVASSSCLHLMNESLDYLPFNATSVTLTPSNHQTTSATVVNTMSNSTAGSLEGTPNPTEFDAPKLSKTKTGRNASKRCLPGRSFKRNLKKVQERLKSEGADVGAVERLGEIFLGGNITKAALKADMTRDQRRTREGKQKYMLLLEVLTRLHGSNGEKDHCCLLCPPWARAEFKNREDSLRHFHKDHFGLAFVIVPAATSSG